MAATFRCASRSMAATKGPLWSVVSIGLPARSVTSPPAPRTRPMGVFSDRTSVDRILFAVFTHENPTQGVPTLFSLTQNI